jgi:peptidoglycan/xylan/chitin deacetylase (PgdA/CDA1 family)
MKDILETALASIYAVFSARKKPHRIVLFYHSVKKDDITSFKTQISYLAGKCKVVKASEILTASINGDNPVVAITFDDAFVNVFENALPVLKKHRLPATIFVPTGNLGQSPKWDIPQTSMDKNDVVMNEKQLMEFNKSGFELLSHTVSHCVLTELDDDTLKDELSNSKSALEKMLGREIGGISYPHGEYNSKVCNAAKKTGYKLGFTIEPAIVNASTDPMRIGRVIVSPHDSLFQFKLKVAGAYQVLISLRNTKRKLLKR